MRTASWRPVPMAKRSDGSPYNLWMREGRSEKVVLFLEDGGACFSAETCDPDNGRYNTTGYANGTAALDHLATRFPDATEIVVIGESAGSVAVPLYTGLAADGFPDARITARRVEGGGV